MAEERAVACKRLSMRAWRRGTKEMDLILGPYADKHLATMDAGALARFDALLDENDQDLMVWVLGQAAPPPALAPLIAAIASHARDRWTPPPG